MRISLLKAAALALWPGFLLLAHEGHDHGHEWSAGPADGPVAITAQAKKNLGLQIEPASLREIDTTLLVMGQIEPIPTRTAAISSRISGRVTELRVLEGDRVGKGDNLFEVESRLLGDPPPLIGFPSPIDGTVIARHIIPGSTVEPESTLLELADLSEVYAVGRIFGGRLDRVQPGQTVRVQAESHPGQVFVGTVERLDPALDPRTGALMVRVRLANPAGQLRPNMRTRLNIVTGRSGPVVAVARDAVLGEAGHLFVFVQSEKDGLVFERRPVVTGEADDRYIEIIEGILPREKIVIAGHYSLQFVPAAQAGGRHNDHDSEAGPGSKLSGLDDALIFWLALALAISVLFNALLLGARRREQAPPRGPAGDTLLPPESGQPTPDSRNPGARP